MLAAMGDSDPSDSLLSALMKARITSENHLFIRRLTDTVGISGYTIVESDKPYVRATRRDGHRDLHINWGFTAGFISEEDARRACGGAGDVAPSSSQPHSNHHPSSAGAIRRDHVGAESMLRSADGSGGNFE